jgi:hypothetical protein
MKTSLAVISKMSNIVPIRWRGADGAVKERRTSRAERETDADICAYLYQICREGQNGLLDKHGITCLFDVCDGRLPLWKCTIVGRFVQTMMRRICACRPDGDATITVALRHRANVWILAVDAHGVRARERIQADAESDLLRFLVESLKAVWRERPTGNGTLSTLLFFDS